MTEYPAGTYTPVTFSGSASPSLPDNSLNISDAITLPTPIPNGAQAWYWTRAAGQAPTVVAMNTNFLVASLGEGCQTATSGVPAGPSSTVPGSVTTLPNPAVLILAQTNVKSAALFGTSRTISVTDATSTTTADRGVVAKTLGPVMAYGNYGIAGESQTTWLTDPILPQLAAYYTHIVANDATNDIYVQTGQAPAVQAYEARWAHRFVGKPYIRQTIENNASSTDSFATTANQTQTTNGAQMQAWNVIVRAATDAPYLEVESGIGADKGDGTRIWSVAGSPPNTADGLHENAAGTAQNLASGLILASTVTGASNYAGSWTPTAINSSAVYSTTAPKFGTANLSTGGLGVWGLIPPSGDFTIECWVKGATFGNAGFIGNALIAISTTTAGLITATAPGQTGLTSATSIADGNWHHVAFVSQQNSAALYIDGVSVATSSGTRTFLNAANRSFGLRGPGTTTGTVTAVSSAPQMDELAVWSFAKYTAGFTPPAAPYVGTETGLVALMHLDDASIVVGPGS